MNFLIIIGAKYLFAVVVLGALVPLVWLDGTQRIQYVLAAFLSGLFGVLFTLSAGAAYFDPRPFTHGVAALIPHAADNGFPSDHTVVSVTAALLCYQVSKLLGAILIIVALVVAACRVLSGVHSPLDVIAGALIAVFATLLGTLLAKKVPFPARKPR